jgi:hypothetical protein
MLPVAVVLVLVAPAILFLGALGTITLAVKWLALADPATGDPRRLRGA